MPPELAARLVTLIASGQADALTGCFIDALEDVAALIKSAEEVKAHDLRKLGMRMYLPAVEGSPDWLHNDSYWSSSPLRAGEPTPETLDQ